jgi:aryl-alcohol dehydrogenase-like predicted oxidoreductase
MRYRLMGRTGLKVSELCLGTMTFGGVPGQDMVPGSDEGESPRVLDAFLEQGGNFIHTADGYTESRSEEILGRGLRKARVGGAGPQGVFSGRRGPE